MLFSTSAANRRPPLSGSKIYIMTRSLFFAFLCLAFSSRIDAQEVIQNQKFKIAIVAPLYLDSAYASNPNKIPSISKAGLDFVQGATIALDTIQRNNSSVEVYIIDSKSLDRSIPWMIQYGQLDNMNLIIGSVREPEYQELARFALKKEIPFISDTYPNDGGIRENPYLAIVNSTLKSHIEGIYSYLLQKHGTDQILLIKKRNDNRIDNMLHEINRKTSGSLLKFRSIAVDSINGSQLAMLIDTTKPAIIVGASLDEDFSLNVADACYSLQQSKNITLIGMPNWDGFKEFYQKNSFKDFPILFTTPHTDNTKNAFSVFLGNQYFTKYRARPSDMVSKGFEAAYYFINILLKYNNSFMQNLNDPQFAPFHTFNFQPVFLSGSSEPDYYENKRVSVVQILNGNILEK